VIVRFRQPPPVYEASPLPNFLRFRISPDIAIGIGVRVKSPGERMEGSPVELRVFQHDDPNAMEAYERLLNEAMKGDATDFAREDYVEEAWRVVDPVLKASTPVFEYEPKTWGPKEVAQVTPPGGWHDPVISGKEGQ
jgi:glucose-6-phosphate 1-dehydrogenase